MESALAPTEPRAVMAPTGTRDRHPVAVYLARLGRSSRRGMRGALDTIASLLSDGVESAMSLDWRALHYQHTQAIRAQLAEKYAPATANYMLSALRGVLRECWRLGLTTAEDYHRAVDIGGVKGTTLPRGRALAQGEITGLLTVCASDPTAAGVRDGAMLAVLYAGGLRRAELASLDLADYDAETGAITVRSGKGNKARIAYIENGAADALADWLSVRGLEPGPLFVHVNKGGVLIHRRLTPQTTRWVAVKRASEAGVAHLSPHDLRRSFVSDLLDAGADISAVQQLAGHASVTTTARYNCRGEVAKRKAAGLLHVPYLRRPALLAGAV